MYANDSKLGHGRRRANRITCDTLSWLAVYLPVGVAIGSIDTTNVAGRCVFRVCSLLSCTASVEDCIPTPCVCVCVNK